MAAWNSCITMKTFMVSLWLVDAGRFLGKMPMGKLFSKKIGNGSQAINRKVSLKFRKSVTIPDTRLKSFAGMG